MANFKNFWPHLVDAEGYFSNDSADSGGATWMGIAYNKVPSWSGWSIIESKLPDFKHATPAQANPVLKPIPELQAQVLIFYKKSQWDIVRGDEIVNQSIAEAIVDFGVNAGFSVPIKKVQEILGLTVDGNFGPKTLAAVNAANQKDLFDKLKAKRLAFYNSLVEQKPSLGKFLNSWTNRTNAIKFVA